MADVLGGPFGNSGTSGNFSYEYSYGVVGGAAADTNEVYGSIRANISFQQNGDGDYQVTGVIAPYAVQVEKQRVKQRDKTKENKGDASLLPP